VLLRNIANFLLFVGPWGLLALAFLDSCGIPIANTLDAYLIFLAIKEPDRAYWYAAIAVAGSTIGNAALFLLARHGGKRFLQRAESGRAQRFRRWFDRFGLVTVFVPAVMPIPMPLKIFVVSAGALRTRLAPFLGVILVARFARYFGETWLGVKLGQESTAYLRHHIWQFVAASVVLVVVLCLIVLAGERWHRRHHPPAGLLGP
jgi:membrane protein YqaA with SNARE-associated domain